MPTGSKITIRCGVGDCKAVIRGTPSSAKKELDRHRASFHKGWEPPSGSIMDRRERLD